jgi:hypothetical protein
LVMNYLGELLYLNDEVRENKGKFQKIEGLSPTGPGKTTYTFSVMFCFPLRPFSVLPAGGDGWVRWGNRKYVGISGKRIH